MSKKPSSIPNPHAPRAPVRVLSSQIGGRPIRRRDFLNGLLVGASGAVVAAALPGCDEDGPIFNGAPEQTLPPITGQDKGDNHEICHKVRDGEMWEIPAAAGDLYDAVIIGGGIAGLCAAYKLRKLGVTNLLVLEKEDPVGGNARLDGPPDSPWGQASAYTVYPYNDALYEVYDDLGILIGYDADGYPILDEQYVIQESVNGAFIDGAWYPSAWDAGIDDLPYSDEIKEDLKEFRDDMLYWYDYVGADDKYAFDTPSDASTEDAEVRALDDISFADYILGKGWAPEIVDFYRPYCRSSFGADPETLSTWAAINFFCSEFGPTISQPGGNAHLALKFAKIIGEDSILTNAFVLRAKNEGAEAHISYLKDGEVTTIRAKTAVYAGPRYLAKYILPDLVASGRDEAKEFNYTPYLVANVHVDSTPEGLGYDNWIQDSSTIFADVIVADWAGLKDPASAPLERPNTLTCYCPMLGEGARQEMLVKTYEEYEEVVLADLEAVFPGISATVTGIDLYRWGHGMLAPGVGFVFGAARVGSQAPEGLISFANHDVDALPAFENAVASAYRAAEEVMAVLSPPMP